MAQRESDIPGGLPNGQRLKSEDVRVGIARRKRERMRERLLSAALEVF